MNSKEIIGSVFGVAFKIVLAVIIIMLVYKYSVQAYDYGYRIFGEGPVTTGEGREVTITVKEGDSVKTIGQTLETTGLIKDAKLFVLQEKVSEYQGKIKPGEYTLNTSMTAEEMIAIMAETVENSEEKMLPSATDSIPEAVTESAPESVEGE